MPSMLTELFREMAKPRSLKCQFILAFAALEAVVVAGGLIAMHTLRVSADSTRQLAARRLVRVQAAQDLLQRTLLIEDKAEQMLGAKSSGELRSLYEDLTQQMRTLENLVERLGSSSTDGSVLDLQQSSQLFRTTANIVAELRQESLQSQGPVGQPDNARSPPGNSRPSLKLPHFQAELHHQGVAMARAAQELTNRFTNDYRGAVLEVASRTDQNQKLVLALFLTSLILAWLGYEYFLRRQVLVRLQEVSNYLRRGGDVSPRPSIPVGGEDEIGEMARAVEQFLADRSRLAEAMEKLKAALKAEEALKREIHHRVKNNLQVIISMLYLQNAELTDPAAQEILRECQSRARSIGLIYARLCARENVAGINFAEYARQLTSDLLMVYRVDPELITLAICPDQITLDVDTAVPCGLITTELVSNALKYAFPKSAKGRIEIGLRRVADRLLQLSVRDNGVGLPEGFKVETGGGLGLRLVADLAKQLDGSLKIQSDNGTSVEITFPSRDSIEALGS